MQTQLVRSLLTWLLFVLSIGACALILCLDQNMLDTGLVYTAF